MTELSVATMSITYSFVKVLKRSDALIHRLGRIARGRGGLLVGRCPPPHPYGGNLPSSGKEITAALLAAVGADQGAISQSPPHVRLINSGVLDGGATGKRTTLGGSRGPAGDGGSEAPRRTSLPL